MLHNDIHFNGKRNEKIDGNTCAIGLECEKSECECEHKMSNNNEKKNTNNLASFVVPRERHSNIFINFNYVYRNAKAIFRAEVNWRNGELAEE